MRTMKYILFILINIALLTPKVNAQEVKDGTYLKNDKLDKFVGTWQWISGDSTLTIILLKTQYNLKKVNASWPDATTDVIIGWHEFSVKNVIIESSLNSKKDYYDYAKKDFTIFGGSPSNDDASLIHISAFKDLTVKNSREGFFTILPNETGKAVLKLHNKQWFESTPRPKNTFPNRFVMKKIK